MVTTEQAEAEKMLTFQELEAEFGHDCEGSSGCRAARFETGSGLWKRMEPDDDAKYAMIGIPYEGESCENVDVKSLPGVKVDGCKRVYDPEDDRELFNNRDWDVLSEISDENSEGGDDLEESKERWRLTVNSFDFCDDDDDDDEYQPAIDLGGDSDCEIMDGYGPPAQRPASKRRRSGHDQAVQQAPAGPKSNTSAGVPFGDGGTGVNRAAKPRVPTVQTSVALTGDAAALPEPCKPAPRGDRGVGTAKDRARAPKGGQGCQKAGKGAKRR